MTVWFGVGLIVYVHVAMLLLALVFSSETRKLRIRVKDLKTKSEKTVRGLGNAVNKGESQAEQDTGAQQSPVPPKDSIFQSKNEPEIGPGGKGQAAG